MKEEEKQTSSQIIWVILGIIWVALVWILSYLFYR